MPVLDKLRTLFQPPEQDGPERRDQSVRMAAAILLLEMEHADFQHDLQERRAVRGQLRQRFGLDEATVEELLGAAVARNRESVSMHRYLSTLNEYLEYADKLAVMEMLWHVAYADGELHRYEEALLRRMAELLYIQHQDFIRVKLDVQKALGL